MAHIIYKIASLFGIIKILKIMNFKINYFFNLERNPYFLELFLGNNLSNKINNIKNSIQSRKIFDCVIFNDEIHLLLLRCEEYYEHIDYFVIVEIDKTHTGHLKLESNFLKNKHLFEKYNDKILFHYFISSPNFVENTIFSIEFFHREKINNILSKYAKENDIILLSDSDEFWNIKILEKIKNSPPCVYVCQQNLFYYYINCMQNQMWVGTISFPYGSISISDARFIIVQINNFIFKLNKSELIKFSNAVEYSNLKIIVDAGNHYSWLNIDNKIYEKLYNVCESSKILKKINKNKNKNENITNKLRNLIESGEDIVYRKGWQFKRLFIDKKSLPDTPLKLDWFLSKYPLLYKQPLLSKIKKNVEIICYTNNNIHFLKMVYKELLKIIENSSLDWYISIKILAINPSKRIINFLEKNKIPNIIIQKLIKKGNILQKIYDGFNLCAFKSSSDNIIFINADMFFGSQWLDNLLKHHDGINIPTSLLIESGNFNTNDYNFLKRLHDDKNNINPLEFNITCKKISKNTIKNHGSYMPVIFERKRFIESGGYPKNYKKIRGKSIKNIEKYFFENILRDKFKMNHITIFDSICYNFQEIKKDN